MATNLLVTSPSYERSMFAVYLFGSSPVESKYPVRFFISHGAASTETVLKLVINFP